MIKRRLKNAERGGKSKKEVTAGGFTFIKTGETRH